MVSDSDIDYEAMAEPKDIDRDFDKAFEEEGIDDKCSEGEVEQQIPLQNPHQKYI
jgi:hypothetical protein